MLVIKASFGGLGSNSMNPAVGGQVFVYFSWSGALSAWGVPRLWPSGISVGAPSVLSPLQYSAEQVMHLATGAGTRAGHFLESYPVSPIATTIAAWLNHVLRTVLDPHYIDLLLGNVPGDIGTVSAVLLLAGGSYLFYKGIITWHAPVGFLATFVVLVWIFGGLPLNLGWFSGLPFFHLLSGATLLAALFLGTDPVTSPLSRGGMVVFGIGIGTLSFLIRILGAAEEAVFMAILLMNISVPAIDRLMERRAHGTA
jgi:electron transport complex protein RnfD